MHVRTALYIAAHVAIGYMLYDGESTSLAQLHSTFSTWCIFSLQGGKTFSQTIWYIFNYCCSINPTQRNIYYGFYSELLVLFILESHRELQYISYVILLLNRYLENCNYYLRYVQRVLLAVRTINNNQQTILHFYSTLV